MRRLVAAAAACAAATLYATPLGADPQQNCVFDSTPLIAFGAYDPTLPTIATTSGTIEFTCKGKNFEVQVGIGAGTSGSMRARTMRNGSAILNYNLYQDAGHNKIWGDFIEEPGVTIFNEKNNTAHRLTVYGAIDAQQDPAVGIFSDSLLVTLQF